MGAFLCVLDQSLRWSNTGRLGFPFSSPSADKGEEGLKSRHTITIEKAVDINQYVRREYFTFTMALLLLEIRILFHLPAEC